MIADLVHDLYHQTGIACSLHLIECGDDGSLSALDLPSQAEILNPGENLGYSGGNNLALRALADQPNPIVIVNPDIRLGSESTISDLVRALDQHKSFGAIAPAIHTPDGRIEYTNSKIDWRLGLAIHTGTYLERWPPGTESVVKMPWIDGACFIVRPEALADVGLFDENYFLYSEEVDWCLRAERCGWMVGVSPQLYVNHRRSASFEGTSKGAYYAYRNSFYLFLKHRGWGIWMVHWCYRLVRFCLADANRKNGESAAAALGAWHALLGRWGRMPRDQ